MDWIGLSIMLVLGLLFTWFILRARKECERGLKKK